MRAVCRAADPRGILSPPSSRGEDLDLLDLHRELQRTVLVCARFACTDVALAFAPLGIFSYFSSCSQLLLLAVHRGYRSP